MESLSQKRSWIISPNGIVVSKNAWIVKFPPHPNYTECEFFLAKSEAHPTWLKLNLIETFSRYGFKAPSLGQIVDKILVKNRRKYGALDWKDIRRIKEIIRKEINNN